MGIPPEPVMTATTDVSVRPLRESDLSLADRIMRLAFGTFLGLPDPAAFMGDVDYVRTRWHAAPEAAFGAVLDGELIGSSFVTRWGSVGFVGPLTVNPDYWDRGIGQRLMGPVMDVLDQAGIENAGLFTFAQSQKHVGLYQKFGFWPRFLTALMSKPVESRASGPHGAMYSQISAAEREGILDACRELTDSVHEGLDLEREIRSVAVQHLGDTVLLSDSGNLVGLAVCHMGAGTEAGSGRCYVKFGAVRPGQNAARNFTALLESCESLAASRGLSRLVAGVNTGRHEAYRQMITHGFRTDMQGIVMQRPNEAGYNRTGVYVIDDWR